MSVDVGSELLATPGAVAAVAESRDHRVAWHYGDPLGEQRAAEEGVVVVDRSHRSVLAITGKDRLSWLHTISSQFVADLEEGASAENLDLDGNGRIQHHFVVTELGETVWVDTEGDKGADLLDFLTRMVFWSDVQPLAVDYAVMSVIGPGVEEFAEIFGVAHLPEVYGAVALAGGGFVRRMPWPTEYSFDVIIPREQLSQWFEKLTAAGARPAGMWAFEALRVVARRPRIGMDTDERTIPHEVGWIGGPLEHGAVHLDKGCYRGQETVARVHNLGKPPRRLVLLHVDGSADERPRTGEAIMAGARAVGRLGTVIDHHELGPIALGLVKRSVPVDTALLAGEVAVAIDPDSVPPEEHDQPGRVAVDRLRRG